MGGDSASITRSFQAKDEVVLVDEFPADVQSPRFHAE